MQKILITLDLSKINKSKITPRTFTNKDGQEITAKDYKMEVIPLKESKVVKQGDGWNLVKTHFIVEGQTKEERDNKKESVFIGDGLQFVDTTSQEIEYPNEGSIDEQIPF